jgi:uncharacterized membrane protein YeaQ/YmgE (transglycosylase-associated protein family)
MSLMGFILLLAIAAVAGILGQALSGYSIGGCLVSILIGFVGAFIGMWLARQLGLPEFLPVVVEGEAFPLFWAVIGSAILSLLFGMISRRRIVY